MAPKSYRFPHVAQSQKLYSATPRRPLKTRVTAALQWNKRCWRDRCALKANWAQGSERCDRSHHRVGREHDGCEESSRCADPLEGELHMCFMLLSRLLLPSLFMLNVFFCFVFLKLFHNQHVNDFCHCSHQYDQASVMNHHFSHFFFCFVLMTYCNSLNSLSLKWKEMISVCSLLIVQVEVSSLYDFLTLSQVGSIFLGAFHCGECVKRWTTGLGFWLFHFWMLS